MTTGHLPAPLGPAPHRPQGFYGYRGMFAGARPVTAAVAAPPAPAHRQRRRPVVAHEAPPLVIVPDVEILEVGENWHLSTGDTTFTPEDIASAIAAQDDPAVRSPVLKLGHKDRRPGFDGQPAFGKLINLRSTNDGMTLVADVAGVPQWLADIWPTAFPSRSIEGFFDYTTATGKTHPFLITALALLGEVEPAIETLADLPVAFGISVEAPAVAGLPPETPAFGLLSAETPAPVKPGSRRFRGSQLPVRAGAVAVHTTATTDAGWSADSAWVNLPNEENGTYYRQACAWYDDDAEDKDGDGLPDTKTAWKFIHHQVNADGSIGAANLTACSSAIGVLNGGRGVDPEAQPWADDREGIYAHLRKHLLDSGRDEDQVPALASAEGEPAPLPAQRHARSGPGPAVAQVTYEDVRRGYYESLEADQFWWWIRELVIDPQELIVDDDEGHLYRVPYDTSGDAVTFGEPQQVRVEYVDVAAARRREGVQVFASRDESREGVAAMDLTALRRSLGLPDTTPDEEVLSQAATRLAGAGDGGAPPGDGQGQPPPPGGEGSNAPPPPPPPPPPSGTAPPAPAPTAPAQPPTAPAPAPSGTGDGGQGGDGGQAPAGAPVGEPAQVPAMASLPPGVVVIDGTVWAQTEANARAGAEALARQRREDRDGFIDSVIRAGRLAPANTELRQYLEEQWDANPQRAQLVAGSLQQTFATTELGHGNAVELTVDHWDKSDVAMFPELAGIRAGANNGRS